MSNYITIAELREAPYSISEDDAADAELDIFLGITKTMIDDLCNLPHGFETWAGTYYRDGKGVNTIFFPEPIITITFLGTVLDHSDDSYQEIESEYYVLYLDEGYIASLQGNFPRDFKSVKATGTFGYAAVPAAIVYLQGMLVKRLVEDDEVMTGIKSETVGNYSYTLFGSDDAAAAGKLNDATLDLIVEQHKWREFLRGGKGVF